MKTGRRQRKSVRCGERKTWRRTERERRRERHEDKKRSIRERCELWTLARQKDDRSQ